MKFSGLILICATSCLALILPAIGVVQFPKGPFQSGVPIIRDSQTQTLSVSAQNPPGNQSNMPWSAPHSSQRDITPKVNGTLISPFPGAPPSPPSLNYPSNYPSSADPTTIVATEARASTTSQKLGLGIWLLLAPICLIGLAMWTFSPNPSGSKSRTFRDR